MPLQVAKAFLLKILRGITNIPTSTKNAQSVADAAIYARWHVQIIARRHKVDPNAPIFSYLPQTLPMVNWDNHQTVAH